MISIDEWLKNFEAGTYSDPSIQVQISAGWIDWSCHDEALYNLTKVLAPLIKQISSSPKLNTRVTRLSLLNSRSPDGIPYNQIDIYVIENGRILYSIIPSYGIRGDSILYDKSSHSQVSAEWCATWEGVLNRLGIR